MLLCKYYSQVVLKKLISILLLTFQFHEYSKYVYKKHKFILIASFAFLKSFVMTIKVCKGLNYVNHFYGTWWRRFDNHNPRWQSIIRLFLFYQANIYFDAWSKGFDIISFTAVQIVWLLIKNNINRLCVSMYFI